MSHPRINLHHRRCCALLVATGLLLATGPSHAQNDDAVKQACSRAYMLGQNLRRDGKLVEARNVILECAQERCPDVLQRDCMQWHDELRTAIPSVVLGVRDAEDQDVTGATILLDGEVWPHALDGTEQALDPGEHVFRIEYRGQSVEQRVLIRQGEKGRLLTFKLEGGSAVTAATATSRSDRTSEPEQDLGPEPAGGSSRTTWGYVLGGVGLVGLGVGGYFGSRAFSKWSERNDHCTDAGCDETAAAASDDAHDAAMIANVGAAVGVLGLGIGGYFLLSGGDEDAASADTASVRAGVGTDGRGAPRLWLTGSW